MTGSSDRIDRRSYSRLGSGINACVFCNGLNGEIKCRIENISEKGICLETEAFEGYQQFFAQGNIITIQFVDSFPFGNDIESDIETINCSVRHVKEKDGIILIGCYVSSDEYRKYVRHRELSGYMQKPYRV
ncbi:MAG: PilZ domain-containing protein [Lachnospiraceae bacterium]|nr:PilZ domain-containing protein [Lachnospiraceae bacterium]